MKLPVADSWLVMVFFGLTFPARGVAAVLMLFVSDCLLEGCSAMVPRDLLVALATLVDSSLSS